MPQFIEQLGTQMGNAITGGIMGMALGGMNDQRQYEQQRKLMMDQEAASKRLQDYSMMNQYNMWLKTGPKGQMEQLKGAGLNPALIYGTSGGGGGTTGSASGGIPSGGAAPSSGGEAQAIMGMGIQMQLLKAQERVLETQADKNAAEAAATGGVQTDLARTQIESLTQGITNQKQIAALTKVQTQIAEAEAQVKTMSIKDSIDYIAWQTGKAMWEMEQAERETYIQKATMNDKIDTIKGEMLGVFIRNALNKAQTEATYTGIKKTETEIQAIVRQGVQKWKELSIAERNAASGEKNAATTEWVNDLQKSTGLPAEILKEAVDGVLRKGGK